MKIIFNYIFCIIISLLLVQTVAADWDEGGPHKMHYPQLPDPNGWDVHFAEPPFLLADDWKCSESGPIDSIHFWVSWYADDVGTIYMIHNNIEGPPYSKPGELLWMADVVPGQFVTRFYGEGPQGWIVMGDQPWWETNNHFVYFQINITNFDRVGSFTQEVGNIYWLDIGVIVSGRAEHIGWKTTTNHFMDDAVYWWQSPDGLVDWYPLIDPITEETLDFAFVIGPIPEPFALFSFTIFFVIFYTRKNNIF